MQEKVGVILEVVVAIVLVVDVLVVIVVATCRYTFFKLNLDMPADTRLLLTLS